MPIIHVYAAKCTSKKREWMESIAETVSKETGTPIGAIYVYFHWMDQEDARILAPVVQFFWAENAQSRGPEQKKRLMAQLTELLAAATGAPKEQVVVTFVDLPLTNVAMGGKARG